MALCIECSPETHQTPYAEDLGGSSQAPLLVPFQGPKKSRFSGPIPSNAPRNDVAPLKTITYRAIKTTGTLIVIKLPVLKIWDLQSVALA